MKKTRSQFDKIQFSRLCEDLYNPLLEKEREVFEEDKSVDIKYFANNFENDLVELLEIEGTQASEDLSRYFLNKKSQRRAETKLAARNSLGKDKLRTQQEYLKDLSNLSDLPESVLSAIQSKYINNQALPHK